MSVQRRKDTEPELRLRKLLHAEGFRYRVNYPVPGAARRTVDIAFTRSRLAVFIDGCFWHGCPQHGTSPSANSDWWAAKLAANHARDNDTNARLVEAGWRVLRIWEHEPAEVAAKIVIDALAAQ